MNKSNVTQLLKTAKKTLSKHSPEILTGIGIAGMITTTALAVKATPKALKLIEMEKKHQNEELLLQAKRLHRETCAQVDRLKPIEVVKVAWKPYIPAAITGVLSTTCLIGASATNYRRNAALATAYQIASTTLTDYKAQVVESIGEKKEKTIRDKVAQKKLDENPEVTREVIVTGTGDVLFVEPVSMRSFTFDIEKLRKVFNDLNYRMVVGMEEYISLSELYSEIGLPKTAVSDDLGWNLGKDGQIEYEFHACTTQDGKPALMIEYLVAPRRGFEKLM